MKKLLLILITAVVGLVAHADKTIYYDNSATNWTAVKIHWWNSGSNADVPMTKYNGNVYSASIPDAATNMLFYNGSWGDYDATKDAPNVTDKHLYYASGASQGNRHTVTDKGVYTSPSSQTYTIYFYDQKNLGSVKTHIWGTNTLHPYKDAQENMTPINKYVYVGGNYYPVYQYTFSWDKVPSGLMFYKTGDNDKQTGDCRFVNNAFYTNGQNVGVTGL